MADSIEHTEFGVPVGAAGSSRVCPGCGSEADAGFAYCPHCGAALALPTTETADGLPVRRERRRRIGGTTWTRTIDADGDSAADAGVTVPSIASGRSVGPHKRKRRRRRRPLYRRPLLVVPLTVLLVATLGVGALAYRAETTLSALQSVSDAPPVVVDNTVGDDPIPSDVAIDSAPAQRAVAEAAAADGQTAAGDGGGGVFGVLKDAASGAGDLAQGAAVAAGVTDPNAAAVTILVMGVDARPGAPIDVSVRPDALMVLRLDPVSGACRALAIPRDTMAELPGYGQTKINHALMVGGIPYQMLVVERLLGIDLDHYALIDFAGFEALVDAVGGVPVAVPQPIVDGAGKEVFAAGAQTFDGQQALAYARYRGGADVDVGRVRRQQQIIRGLLGVARGRDAVGDVNRLLPALEGHVRTDLDASELIALAEHYRAGCTEDGLVLDSLQGNFVASDTPDPIFKRPLTYNVVDEATIREKVAALDRP